MNDDVVRLEDRRRAASNRLVVLDIDSIGHFWSEIVDPDDLVARSVLIRSLLEARREGDVFLIGCDPTMGWAMTEVFPGAVLFLGDGTVTERRPLTVEFVRHYRTGRFGEVCVVTGDERRRPSSPSSGTPSLSPPTTSRSSRRCSGRSSTISV